MPTSATVAFDQSWLNPSVSAPVILNKLYELKAGIEREDESALTTAIEMQAIDQYAPAVTVPLTPNGNFKELFTGACAPLLAARHQLRKWRAARGGAVAIRGRCKTLKWPTAVEAVAAIWGERNTDEICSVVQKAYLELSLAVEPDDILDRLKLRPCDASDLGFYAYAAISMDFRGMSDRSRHVVQKVIMSPSWKSCVFAMRACRSKLYEVWRDNLNVDLTELQAELEIELAELERLADISPPPRLVCDESTSCISLDGEILASGVSPDVMAYFRELWKVYPGTTTFEKMKPNDPELTNQSRIKRKMPRNLKELVESVPGDGTKLVLPPPK